MEENNTDYAPKLLLVEIDYSLGHEYWNEFSWRRYSEKVYDCYENPDEIPFLGVVEFMRVIYDDPDIFFDLLCEEMDELICLY